jgi:transcriptional regulator with XRE-family HTH domain
MCKQKELAQELGITPQHLNAVLRGRVRPSLKLALRIERATGTPVETFIPELSDTKGKRE